MWGVRWDGAKHSTRQSTTESTAKSRLACVRGDSKRKGFERRWRPREEGGAKGKRYKQNESTRQDRELWWGEPLAMGRGAWDELVGRGTRSQLAQDRVNGRTN